jgi:putative ABC transport system substrate-binding protein
VIDRRSIVAGIVTLPFAARVVRAQSLRKSWRIGVLNAGPKDGMAAFDKVLEDGLRQAGYGVGTDVWLDYRYPEWTGANLPALAAELVSLNVDVIVAMTNPGIAAAKQATNRVPIVMGLGADPVGAGFVESLARPAGNITGLTADPTLEIVAKELQYLKEATPGLSRVAVLWNATVATYAHFFKALVDSHQRAGFVLASFPVDKRENLERAFGDIARSGADGICVFADAITFGYRHVIADFAIKRRLPMSGYTREYAEAGALLSYGPNLLQVYRGTAGYVERILKGGSPATLPVQLPTKFELVINLGTARALGIRIAPSFLARADHVIE